MVGRDIVGVKSYFSNVANLPFNQWKVHMCLRTQYTLLHLALICSVYICPLLLIDCKFADESVLRDLKALLLEAKQKVPPFLDQMGLLSDELLELGGRLSLSLSVVCSCSLCVWFHNTSWISYYL